MKLLALEFSSSRRSVALHEIHDHGIRELCQVEETDFRKVTSAALIETALRETQTRSEEISRIAIGLGPGSYTGIRGAIAFAQGWQLATKAELYGISSIEALAMEAWMKFKSGKATLAIDAQRREVYCANYDLRENGPVPLDELRIVPVFGLKDESLIAGPDLHSLIPQAIPLHPQARTLAQLAWHSKIITPGEQLTPIYLRDTTFIKAPPPRTII